MMVRRLSLVLLVVMAAVALASCGGSSKPAYCSDVNNFKDAVKGLTSVSSPSDIVSNVQKVQSTGDAAISSVKGAFAPQTTALKTALSNLAGSVKQLASATTRAGALSAIPGQVTAVEDAATAFADAAKQKCG